jgi:ABC-type nitrate/sulfonate/bicarbonate transport system substrate-binding protein
MSRKKRTLIFAYIVFFASLVLPGLAAAQEVTVSYASLGAAYMDHVAAMEKGYLAEEGLNVKIMRSSAPS